MEAALQKVMTAENNTLARLRGVLYGTLKPGFKAIDSTIHISTLNASQNEAVRKVAAANDVAIIHGPPGTGKTTTLVQAIKYTLISEKQVLACSPSNVAVDLLTTEEISARRNKCVLRLGNPARVSEEVLQNTLDAKIAHHPYYQDLKVFSKRAEEFYKLAHKYKRNFWKSRKRTNVNCCLTRPVA